MFPAANARRLARPSRREHSTRTKARTGLDEPSRALGKRAQKDPIGLGVRHRLDVPDQSIQCAGGGGLMHRTVIERPSEADRTPFINDNEHGCSLDTQK